MLQNYDCEKYPLEISSHFVCEVRCDIETGSLPEAPVVTTVAGEIESVFDYSEEYMKEMGSSFDESKSASVSIHPEKDDLNLPELTLKNSPHSDDDGD